MRVLKSLPRISPPGFNMSALQILAYRGKSTLSGLIRWQTDSQYSHIATRFTQDIIVATAGRRVQVRAGNVIEAWTGGVLLNDSLSTVHSSRTPVDVFEFKEPLSAELVRRVAEFQCRQIGKGYDYAAIFRFLTREPENQWMKDRWFCSELCFAAFQHSGLSILERIQAYRVRPRDIPISPLLRFVRTEPC